MKVRLVYVLSDLDETECVQEKARVNILKDALEGSGHEVYLGGAGDHEVKELVDVVVCLTHGASSYFDVAVSEAKKEQCSVFMLLTGLVHPDVADVCAESGVRVLDPMFHPRNYVPEVLKAVESVSA